MAYIPGSDALSKDQPASNRLVLLDALRALALAGVCFANLEWFSAYRLLRPAVFQHWPLYEQVTRLFSLLFVDEKAFGLFSLLFGVGFALQMHRAQVRGADGTRLFARRLVVLLGIGLLHWLGLWYGDILHLYALCGFGLLLFRRCSTRTLLIWGFSLTLSSGLVGWLGNRLFPPPSEEQLLAMQAGLIRIFAGPSLSAMLAGNFRMAILLDQYWGVSTGLLILGRLLLGYCFGRWALQVGFFQNPGIYRAMLRRVWNWMLPLGLAGGILLRVIRYLLLHAALSPANPVVEITNLLAPAFQLALALAYASGFALLGLRPVWRARLRWVAPLGQMALTNYLLQTLLGLWIFYGYGAGLGLIGRVGPLETVPICLAELGLQLAFSRWWLQRFRFGPAEWVWRSLTYGSRQPWRRQRPEDVAALRPAQIQPKAKPTPAKTATTRQPNVWQ